MTPIGKVANSVVPKSLSSNYKKQLEIYGKTNNLPVNEMQNCNPKGFYSITKKCAEDLIISFSETFNINYRIIRLSNVLGKGDQKISNKYK